MRRGLRPALLVAVIVLGGGGGAATGARDASACRRLRGADLAPAPAIKLVRRADGDLAGCALPRGRVRTIASGDARIVQVAGAYVLVTARAAAAAASTQSTSVTNAGSGDSYEVAFACTQPPATDCGRGGVSSTALKAIINVRGQAAAALTFAHQAGLTISGFSPLGERGDYDSGPSAQIPAASLRLHLGKAIWTNDGRPYSAVLPQ